MVKLRTKTRLLDLTAVGLLATSTVVVTLALQWRPPVIDAASPRLPGAAHPAVPAAATAGGAGIDPSSWNRVLRQPLYDPPPPAVQEVVAPPRPITVTLVGTVIESANSQAFVRQATGALELKRLGDQLTADPADGVIQQISPSEIVISRADGEHHVPVAGRN